MLSDMLNFLIRPPEKPMTYIEFIERQIGEFRASPVRKNMIDGVRYYAGEHDILQRKRSIIGEDGDLVAVENLPNNRVVDNQYKRLVQQKVNYLAGQPIAFHSDNEAYNKCLSGIFDKGFLRMFKNIVEDSLNCGIAFMYIYLDENGEIAFKRFRPFEVIPGWADSEHTKLDYFIRLYEVIYYEGRTEKTVTKAELYDKEGIRYFELKGSQLVPDPDKRDEVYLSDGVNGYNWERIPIVAFKYNDMEIPLLRDVRSLQDGLNLLLSNFQNGMEEDVRNTILVLRNYDGEGLGEFRRNLATYGAVKVRSVDGMDGGVETLNIEVNSENYKTVIDLLKKAIIENGKGYDVSELRGGGTPNQMNIQSVYSDIDLDANGMETEYQAGFEQLLWFVDVYLANTGKGSFDDVPVDITFNRDMLIDESGVIDNCLKSQGILSNETILKNHPWVDDLQQEQDRLKEEGGGDYGGAFNS